MVSTDKLIEETMEHAEKENVGVHVHLNEEIAELDHALSRWENARSSIFTIENSYQEGYLQHIAPSYQTTRNAFDRREFGQRSALPHD